MTPGAKHKRFSAERGAAKRQPGPQGTLARVAVTDCTPALLPARQFPEGWQRERARRLQRLCRVIQKARLRGESVENACRRLSRYWRGRTFQCDPKRPLHFSFSTLRRVYFATRKNTSALALRYKGDGVEFTFSAGERARAER